MEWKWNYFGVNPCKPEVRLDQRAGVVKHRAKIGTPLALLANHSLRSATR